MEQLRDLEAQLPFPEKEETEWAQRKRILAENWASSRNELFSCLLMKNSIPEAGTCCSNCQINVAVLRCIECKKLLCSDCDNKAHTEYPFHDREMWINGFYEGIGNRMTIFDYEVCVTGIPCITQ